MGKPYSEDLRARVIAAAQDGATIELKAVKRLRELSRAGQCSLYRSHIALGELERTKNRKQAKRLKAEYKLLKGILRTQGLAEAAAKA